MLHFFLNRALTWETALGFKPHPCLRRQEYNSKSLGKKRKYISVMSAQCSFAQILAQSLGSSVRQQKLRSCTVQPVYACCCTQAGSATAPRQSLTSATALHSDAGRAFASPAKAAPLRRDQFIGWAERRGTPPLQPCGVGKPHRTAGPADISVFRAARGRRA